MVKVSVRLPKRSLEATAEIMSETEYNQISVMDTIKVGSLELAEKIVARYNLERQEKNRPISLASARDFVQQEEDCDRTDEFIREQREAQNARLEAEAKAKTEKERLDSNLKERALLRVNLLSKIMPTLLKQNFDNFTTSGGTFGLVSTADVIKSGYLIVDEMIKQSGLDDI